MQRLPSAFEKAKGFCQPLRKASVSFERSAKAAKAWETRRRNQGIHNTDMIIQTTLITMIFVLTYQ